NKVLSSQNLVASFRRSVFNRKKQSKVTFVGVFKCWADEKSQRDFNERDNECFVTRSTVKGTVLIVKNRSVFFLNGRNNVKSVLHINVSRDKMIKMHEENN